jgi:hypothetical protein
MYSLKPGPILRTSRRIQRSRLQPLAAVVHSFATVSESLPRLANPPYRDTLPSSPATSSKVTLDQFPVGEKGILIDDDPITSFGATDQDLINAILLNGGPSSGSPLSLQWASTIDPAFAFLCLRRRSSYFPFLQIVSPHLKRLHEQFRPALVFQLLATDLLLWNPDHRGFRELLELEALGNGHLRSSHIVSIFNLVRAALNTGTLPPLSRKASMHVLRSLIAEGEIEMIPDAWRGLFAISAWEPEAAWALFSIVLHLVRHDAVDTALPLVQLLVERGLISESAFKKSNPRHPKAKVLLVQSIVLRSCLEFKLYLRSQRIAEDLVDTMESSELSTSATELLLETCRATIAAKKTEEIAWAGGFMQRLAELNGFPSLPASLFDAYIDSVSDTEAVRFFKSLPEAKRPTPSPRSILSLASGQRTRANLLELMQYVNRIPPANFLAQRAAFLRCLADAGLPRLVRTCYHTWASSFTLDADLMLSLVRCLASTSRPVLSDKVHPASSQQREAARNELAKSASSIIGDFKRVASSSLEDQLALARAYLLAKDTESAQRILSRLDASNSRLIQLIDELALTDTPAAVQIMRLSAELDRPLGSVAAMISRACNTGHWEILSGCRLSDIPKDERPEFSVLQSIRQGKVDKALRDLKRSRDISPTTYDALIARSGLAEKWMVSSKTWEMAIDAHPEHPEVFAVQGYALLNKLRSLLGGEDRKSDRDVCRGSRGGAERVVALRRKASEGP